MHLLQPSLQPNSKYISLQMMRYYTMSYICKRFQTTPNQFVILSKITSTEYKWQDILPKYVKLFSNKQTETKCSRVITTCSIAVQHLFNKTSCFFQPKSSVVAGCINQMHSTTKGAKPQTYPSNTDAHKINLYSESIKVRPLHNTTLFYSTLKFTLM